MMRGNNMLSLIRKKNEIITYTSNCIFTGCLVCAVWSVIVLSKSENYNIPNSKLWQDHLNVAMMTPFVGVAT